MKRILQGLLLSISIAASAAWADATDELSDLLKPLEALSGNFKQTLIDERGKVTQKSNGSFSVQRPGKLRWKTGEPYAQLLVTNNKTLWLYDPDLEQVTVRPVDARIKDTPALLLGGEVEDIRGSFNVSQKEGVYHLTPKNPSAPFKAMEIRFAKNGLPSAMTVRDGMGQITEIQFSAIKANPKLSASIFDFKPPAGTDIIKDE
ncbi:outer membrane lipoprotein carrier protein LolA [Microbulbifer sp. A4B17]|uniref:outer membrane lipoprotein chaperone LolA n=1 Tax=Microbulbifer sp. A4B17 TaxID=359370 RepID=UPI000D52C13E|nr:outer membrane lipoprotein chaperone LolA [Microbulbifer sp. A4B17]AWF81148.1 outer membrane lipoprotein carrier protein LolA [Microbulbifer sp. A4B17]